jgi:hypothetical protein
MRKPRRAVRGGPNTVPMSSVKYSGVSSNSAIVEDTKFAGPHKSRMRQYITQFCSPGPNDRSLIDTDGGYHFEVLNLTLDHSQPSHPVFPTFPWLLRPVSHKP